MAVKLWDSNSRPGNSYGSFQEKSYKLSLLCCLLQDRSSRVEGDFLVPPQHDRQKNKLVQDEFDHCATKQKSTARIRLYRHQPRALSITIPSLPIPPAPVTSHDSGCWLYIGHGGTMASIVNMEPAVIVQSVRKTSSYAYPTRNETT